MKKYIFNGYSLGEKELYGIQRNTIEILKKLDYVITDDMNVSLVVPMDKKYLFSFKNIKVVELPYKNSIIWRKFTFPNYVKKEKGVGIDSLLLFPARYCDVIFIYDCITELFPQNSISIKEKLFRKYYIRNVKRAVKVAKHIITDSISAKTDIEEMYEVDERKISIVPCAWQHFCKIDFDDNIIQKLDLENKDYFFSLGSRSFHKNTKWIIEAAKQNPQYYFVITGSNNINSSDLVLSDYKLDNVIYTGYLTDQEIKSLMRRCKAFIQPSLYEGFGIPPMEAMSVGARCIVSNVSSLPGIYKDSVWYINPYDYEYINLDKIMQNQISNSKKILDNYDWSKSAYILKDILIEKVK